MFENEAFHSITTTATHSQSAFALAAAATLLLPDLPCPQLAARDPPAAVQRLVHRDANMDKLGLGS
jgi:hypothetical protein